MIVCILASVIRHANCTFVRRTILSSAVCLAVPYIPTLSHKRHDCRGGGGNEHKTWFFISSTSSVKYALFLPYFNETNPLDGFS